jgi:MFS transporter, putative metabolite transport protein
VSLVDFEDAPFRRAHWKLAIGATTGYLSDGYTLGVVGIALAGAQSQLALSPGWLGALGSGSLAGLLVGALFCGPAADRFGRRSIFAYNMIAFVVLSLLQLWVRSSAELLAIRFFLGVVLRTDYVVVKALLAEFMPRLNRGRALSLMGVAWALGYALAYVAGFTVQNTHPGTWRFVLASSAIPALISIPLRLSARESPLWLCLRGRREEAQRVIDTSLGPRFRLPSTPARNFAASPGRELLSRRYRRPTFVACALYVCLVVPYFAVSTFIPQVMAALNVSGNETAGLIYVIGLMVGSVGGLLMVDGFPRRVFVIGSFAVTSAALLLSAFSADLPDFLTVLAFAVFSIVLSAAQAQIYVYLPELFPTWARTSGLGIAVAVSRLGAAAATFLLPLCVARYGVRAALDICIATLVMGGLVCYLWAPETRHVRLAVENPV